MVNSAFEHVACGASHVSFEDLCQAFRADHHPRAASREKTADSVAAEFRAGMQKYVGEDGQVSQDGWCNYYLDFNCVLPWEKDTYFRSALSESWGLTADKNAVPA
jgi:Ca2+-binding EF-hand superfamily protein